MKSCVWIASVLVLISFPLLADEGHQHHHDADTEQLGTVSFPTSCASSVQKPFERGVALLHSFAYGEAEQQFKDVEAKDPKCAIAHWGEAMGIFHQLWDRPDAADLKRGWGTLHAAQAMKATPRESGYIDALAAFYRDSDKIKHEDRTAAYSKAMEKVYTAYPQDHEAAAFYALSLLTADPPHDTSLVNRRKAIAILDKLMQEEPNHPGVAHYLIHTCDNPQLAQLGLPAARRYAQIAPSSPHAVHMPSHIFARLGLWQEDIHSNLASVAATEKSHMGGEAHSLHALDFLEYAYLQIGDDAKAKAIVDRLPAMKAEKGDSMYAYVHLARVRFPAVYYIETRQWKEALALEPPTDARPSHKATIYWANAVAAGHLKDSAAAQHALDQYDAMVEAQRKSSEAYIADYMDLDRDEAHAWTEFSKGNNNEALKLMRAVADRQDAEGKEETELPAREMLADMLLHMDHPQEALAEYETSMKIDPNRFNGLYGAAHAAELIKNTGKARTYYAQLLKNCEGANSDRPELKNARMLLASK